MNAIANSGGITTAARTARIAAVDDQLGSHELNPARGIKRSFNAVPENAELPPDTVGVYSAALRTLIEVPTEPRPITLFDVAKRAIKPNLIIEVPARSAIERQLRTQPPDSVASGRAVIDVGATDEDGNLESPSAGKVVLSVPSPETLVREADEVRRVIAHGAPGTEPLVVVVEAADELRDEELVPVLNAAAHAERPVILRVIRPA